MGKNCPQFYAMGGGRGGSRRALARSALLSEAARSAASARVPRRNLVAQEVARRYLEPILEPLFHTDSYGYRPSKSAFYKTQLRPTLKRIDAYVIKWARPKFKRMRHQTKGARDWFDRFRRANPKLLAHWSLCHGGRTMGAV
jgi:hypothetical protein